MGSAAIIVYFQNYVLGMVAFLLKLVGADMRKQYLPSHMYLGIISLLMTLCAIQTGLTNQLASCAYRVSSPDVNPASNYHLLPLGCRIGNGISVTVLIALLLTVLAVLDVPKPN